MKIFEDILDDLEKVSSGQRNIDDLTKSRDVVRKDYDNPDDYEYCLVLGILVGNPTQKIEELFDSLSYIADGWKFDNSGFVAVANREELTERFEFPVYYVPEIKDGFFDKKGVLQFRLMFNVPNFIELPQEKRRKRIFQFINFLATICGIEGKIFQNDFYIHDIYRRDDDNEFKWFQRGDWIEGCRAFLYNQERLTPSNRIRRVDLDIIKEIDKGLYATFYLSKYENQHAQLSKDLKAIFLEQNKKLFKD